MLRIMKVRWVGTGNYLSLGVRKTPARGLRHHQGRFKLWCGLFCWQAFCILYVRHIYHNRVWNSLLIPAGSKHFMTCPRSQRQWAQDRGNAEWKCVLETWPQGLEITESSCAFNLFLSSFYHLPSVNILQHTVHHRCLSLSLDLLCAAVLPSTVYFPLLSVCQALSWSGSHRLNSGEELLFTQSRLSVMGRPQLCGLTVTLTNSSTAPGSNVSVLSEVNNPNGALGTKAVMCVD